MSIIDVEAINFSYRGQDVLENVTFQVAEGDYLGVVGPNGSGKTTLLKLILGLLTPNSGRIRLFGHAPTLMTARWKTGYVPQRATQEDFQFPATVQEVVQCGRVARRGLGRFLTEGDRRAVSQAMARAGVAAYQHRLLGQLSGGERQRVFIARALAGEPKLLILDEPTVGVDVASQEEFYTLLCELNKKHGLTIMLVSHDIDVIAQEVKTVLFLNRKVIGYGLAAEMMRADYLEKLYGSRVKFLVHRHH